MNNQTIPTLGIDEAYLSRLLQMVESCGPSASAEIGATGRKGGTESKGQHMKCLLLAFDKVYDHTGAARDDLTSMYLI